MSASANVSKKYTSEEYNQAAHASFRSGNFESAFYYWNQALQLYKKSKDKSRIQATLHNLSVTQLKQGNLTASCMIAASSLNLDRTICTSSRDDSELKVNGTDLSSIKQLAWL